MDQFISGLLKLDFKHLTVEKRRELAIQIRSFDLERLSNRQSIHQTVQDLCNKIDWHFQMLNSYDQLYNDYTLSQLDQQQLVSEWQVKIPRSRIIHKQAKSVPHLHLEAIKARLRSVKKLQSTLSSASSPILPQFGNISHISTKSHFTIHYKGNRRSSLKADAMSKARNRSSQLNASQPLIDNDNDAQDADEDADSEPEEFDPDSGSIVHDKQSVKPLIKRLMNDTNRKQQRVQLGEHIQVMCSRIEQQFDLWIQQLDPDIANRPISDFDQVEITF